MIRRVSREGLVNGERGENVYVVEYVVGLLIVLVTIVSVLFILVLPRQPQGLEKLTLIVNKSVTTRSSPCRDWRGPTRKGLGARTDRSGALLAQLLFWAASLVLDSPDAHEYDALVRPRSDPSTDSALHRGRDSQRRAPNTALDIAPARRGS